MNRFNHTSWTTDLHLTDLCGSAVITLLTILVAYLCCLLTFVYSGGIEAFS